MRTSTWGPPLMTSPSTTSKLSSSRRFEATSGRYQPGGGGGRRARFCPSKAPRRSRMRLMVRTEGSGSTLRAVRAWWMASAPWNPRSLDCSNSLRTARTRSSMAASVRGGPVVSRGGRASPLGPAVALSVLDPVVERSIGSRGTLGRPPAAIARFGRRRRSPDDEWPHDHFCSWRPPGRDAIFTPDYRRVIGIMWHKTDRSRSSAP